MKTITYSQYLQFLGLREIVRKHDAICQQALGAAADITGEDIHGHTSDIMFDSRDVDEGLRLMEITVEAPPPKANADNG